MRRPAPLPSAPSAPSDDEQSSREASRSIIDDEASARPPLLPAALRPRDEPAEDRAPSEAAEGERAGDEVSHRDAESSASAAADEPIGLRDVWAAARARRRALRAEVRRFTVRQRRRRMIWISTLGALVVLVLGSIGAAYSPLFAVERIEVLGTSGLNPTEVADALAGQLGTPMPLVDSSEVKAALVQFPLVESYTLEARPPHDLVVRIVERTPIGAVASAAGYTLVDAAGVALSTTPQPPDGHPVIDAQGGIGSEAFGAIGTVFRTLPGDIRSQVTAMSASSANDVTLTLGGTGTEVVWGNADESAKKAIVLASAMQARPPADVYSYDVSSPGAIVIR